MDLFGRARIAGLEAELGRLERELAEARRRARALFDHGVAQVEALPAYFEGLLADNARRTRAVLAGRPLPAVAGWSDPRWAAWRVEGPVEEGQLRVGELVERRAGSDLGVPAYLPFIGRNRTIVIRTDAQSAALGAGLLQSLAVRTALMLPYGASYTLLDPAGAGLAFPMRRYLPQVREGSGDIRRDLDQVMIDIQRIIEAYLDAATTSFEQVPEEIRVNERFQLVFAADFPNKYDRRTVEALQSIGKTGPVAGVYLFVHYNEAHPLPRDVSLDGFENASYLDLVGGLGPTIRGLELVPDGAPPAEVQAQVFVALTAYRPGEQVIEWTRSVGIPQAHWWHASADALIETPIGLRGQSEPLRFWFGNRAGRACGHGILGAMTGAGKSNLLHALICGLAVRYGPDELRLYLVDGKHGEEFRPYRNLPQAEVISLHSPPELARSVLAELVEELKRRARIFARADAQDFAGYRRRDQPGGKLPRILLILDECQELFEDDRDGLAAGLLRELTEQGAAAGIHLLLASQSFNLPGMLNRASILGNVQLRAAMQLTASDREALAEFGRRGKALIAACDRPGRIVVNDRGGADTDGANLAGSVAFLRTERRDEVLRTLAVKAAGLPGTDLPRRVVLDGRAQPVLIENPCVVGLLERPGWPGEVELRRLARAPAHRGGFDVYDWFPTEHPRAVWLGQEFSVRGQAMLHLRRRAAEHALVVGGAGPERYGMLAAILAGSALNYGPDDQRYVIVDRAIPEAPWSEALREVYDLTLGPAGFQTVFAREDAEVEALLGGLLAELDRRRGLDEQQLGSEPSILVTMAELDRVSALRRRAGSYGMADTPLGGRLARLYAEGGPLGIHLVLAFAGLRPLVQVIDERRGLFHFRHRIALQMSEDDSYTFVRSREAALLQTAGPTPVCGLYVDAETGRGVRFKPYSWEPDEAGGSPPLAEQLRAIGATLAERAGVMAR